MTRWARWSDAEIAELVRLRNLGWTYRRISAALPGRSIGSCQTRHCTLPQTSVAPVATVQAPAPAAPSRAISTARLHADSELRQRIAEMGITAGLLGDPPPGRSALDKKRDGAAG